MNDSLDQRSEPTVVGFEAKPIPTANTVPMKAFAVAATFLLFLIVVFSLPTTKVKSPRDFSKDKYVAPWKNKPSRSPDEVKTYVDNYLKKSTSWMNQ